VAGGPAENPVDPYWKTRSILNGIPGRSLIGDGPSRAPARARAPARVRVCACARVRARACARVRVCACARVRVCACAGPRVCGPARVRARACARVPRAPRARRYQGTLGPGRALGSPGVSFGPLGLST
jgi:hypothetical protein